MVVQARRKKVFKPPPPPMLPDSVADWRTLDVITWVGEVMQLPQYAEAFAEGAVDGQMLVSLTDGDLKDELGVESAAHR